MEQKIIIRKGGWWHLHDDALVGTEGPQGPLLVEGVELHLIG